MGESSAHGLHEDVPLFSEWERCKIKQLDCDVGKGTGEERRYEDRYSTIVVYSSSMFDPLLFTTVFPASHGLVAKPIWCRAVLTQPLSRIRIELVQDGALQTSSHNRLLWPVRGRITVPKHVSFNCDM